MTNPILICGFYGIGKSYLQKHRPDLDIYDHHSFPREDYLLEHLDHRYVVADPDWIKVFTSYAQQTGCRFYVVLPSLDRRQEFLDNYLNRTEGMHNELFVRRRDRFWTKQITALKQTPGAEVITLKTGFLADIIDDL